MKTKVIFIMIVSIFVAALAGIFLIYQKKEKNEERIKIENAIDRGVDFLSEKQTEGGEFNVYECRDENLSECSVASSSFGTTFVLYSIEGIENEKVAGMTEAGLNFLQNEKFPGGLWYFYAKNANKGLPFDLDDTAMASYVLKKNGRELENNKEIIEKNVNEEKIFYTWVNPFGFNDTDCAVNANILMYLEKNNPEVCRYTNEEIISGNNCSPYYPDKLAVYYIVSRAFREGADCLGESKNKILDEIFKLQKEDGSFGNDLQTAFAANALMNFGYQGNKLEKSIEIIAKKQAEDGSWEEGISWTTGGDEPLFYGSKELTTALSLEALKRY